MIATFSYHRLKAALLLCVSVAVTLGQVAPAAPSPNAGGPVVSFISENDNYVPPRDDRHYTSGLKLVYGFARDKHPEWLDGLGRFSLLDTGSREYDIAIGQNIYTPTVFTFPGLILNDRPYAGWLYGEVAMNSRAAYMEEHISLSLGIVGPAALGKEAQRLIHSISGDPKPRGWSHQLENEPALLLHYRRSWFRSLHDANDWEVDLVPRLGLSLGNVVTEAGIGSSLRIGSYLPQRELFPRIQPGLNSASARFEVRRGRTDWVLATGLWGRVVAHNIFLDGNTWQDSHSVERKDFTWDASLGLMLTFGQFSKPVALSFSHVWRGKEFAAQKDIDRFGSIRISIQF